MSLLSPRSNLADSARAIRSSISVAGTVRVARVTTTLLRPAVSIPISAWSRTALRTASHGYGAGIAEVGRAEDRHVGDDAGIFDQIADAHDVAVDNRFGLQSWLDLANLRDGGRYEGAERDKCGKEYDVIMARPQRIMLAAADNIWSAAVITLAFIS